ncbi:LOG family protein [Actinopolymorpha singaporensis]|nr:TIGR00730 family Rossman fold protein [Actinopolymorpha singaporensis]
MRMCVFCGSSPGRDEIYGRAAADLAVLLAHKGIGLVYGGGNIGLMGIAADAALAAGGEVIGVIPGHLVDREVSHDGLSRLEVVDTMHERKARMADLSDAFVALPGGAGTLDELFEMWTWSQLGLHHKPIGLLDVAGYYQPMLTFLDHMTAERFLRPAYRDALVVETDPRVLVDRLTSA